MQSSSYWGHYMGHKIIKHFIQVKCPPSMKLSEVKCKSIKPEQKTKRYFDGGGLYLEVTPKGSRYWRLKYRFNTKEKRLALGIYPTISLKTARERLFEAKQQLANNIDPSAERQRIKQEHLDKTANLFENIAQEWHSSNKASWTKRHGNYILRRLEADIFPPLSNRPINEITSQDLLQVLRKVEARGAIDIAKRLRQTCGQIFRYAIATGRAERDISHDLKDALKARKKTNYSRLDAKELPEFMHRLESYDGELQTKIATKLLIYTFVRTGEVRGAKWSEFDFDKKEWRIPAERMKMRESHIVPLSSQVIQLLRELETFNGTYEHLFPNRNKPTTYISENTILYAIYRLGYHSRTTAHGFRATASTILNEHGFMPDVIERQLAHAERNKVRATYNHAQYLPERRKMMQWWADYLNNLNREYFY